MAASHKAGVLTAVILFAAALPIATAGQIPDLARRDWSGNAKLSLTTTPPTKAAVAALLAHAENVKEGTAATTLPQDEDVESFQFVNLRGSGVLSLVVETDLNERYGFYDVQILDKTPKGIAWYSMSDDGGPDQVAQDLDGDGKYELVIDEDSIPQCPTMNFPVIYAWTGARYENVSDRFPRFYQRRLETLRKEIEARQREWAAAAKASKASQPQEPLDCGKIEAAKIERFLGQSPEAGLDYAIALSRSAEWRDQMLAANVLADIGTPEAIAHLHALSGDSNPSVAGTAKNVLVRAKFEPPAEISRDN